MTSPLTGRCNPNRCLTNTVEARVQAASGVLASSLILSDRLPQYAALLSLAHPLTPPSSVHQTTSAGFKLLGFSSLSSVWEMTTVMPGSPSCVVTVASS